MRYLYLLFLALCFAIAACHHHKEMSADDSSGRTIRLNSAGLSDKFRLSSEGGWLTVLPPDGCRGWEIGLAAYRTGEDGYTGIDKRWRVSGGYDADVPGMFVVRNDTLLCRIGPNESDADRTILLNMNLLGTDGRSTARVIYVNQPSSHTVPTKVSDDADASVDGLKGGCVAGCLKVDKDCFCVPDEGGCYEIVERGVVPDWFIDDIRVKDASGGWVLYLKKVNGAQHYKYDFGEFTVHRDTLRCRIFPLSSSASRTIQVRMSVPGEWLGITFVQKPAGR